LFNINNFETSAAFVEVCALLSAILSYIQAVIVQPMLLNLACFFLQDHTKPQTHNMASSSSDSASQMRMSSLRSSRTLFSPVIWGLQAVCSNHLVVVPLKFSGISNVVNFVIFSNRVRHHVWVILVSGGWLVRLHRW